MSESATRVGSTLAELEASLDSLWTLDSPEQATAHAHTLNLVAVSGDVDHDEFVAQVDELSMRLAARTFIVTLDRSREAQPLSGQVSAVCRVEPGERRPSVCAERLELTLGALRPPRIRSIFDSLIQARLPTVLYVGPGASPGVVGAIAGLCTSVVLDSAQYGVTRAAELAKGKAAVFDLAFMRGQRVRELLARFFDARELRPALHAIREIEIVYSPGSRCKWPSAEAELVVSWLATRLGWTAEMGDVLDESGTRIDVTLSARESAGESSGRLQSLSLSAVFDRGSATLDIARTADGDHFCLTFASDQHGHSQERLFASHRSAEELALRAISSVTPDTLARDALVFAQNWARGT